MNVEKFVWWSPDKVAKEKSDSCTRPARCILSERCAITTAIHANLLVAPTAISNYKHACPKLRPGQKLILPSRAGGLTKFCGIFKCDEGPKSSWLSRAGRPRKLYVKIRRSFIPLAFCILFCLGKMAVIKHVAYAHQVVSNEAKGTRVVEYSFIRRPYSKFSSGDKA
jgi:hypothetical protein